MSRPGDENLISEMGKFGYTVEKLKAENELVSEASRKSQSQQKETGEAQLATQDRDLKVKELDKRLSDFRAVAKIAFSDKPQQLEKIGILARSSIKTAARPKEETPPVQLS